MMLIRGRKVDDAIDQLKFMKTKNAGVLRDFLEETRELAVRDHNVEFRSNLWVCKYFMQIYFFIFVYLAFALVSQCYVFFD